jgi:hypothetical protein
MEYILTFNSTNQAIKAERLLLAAHLAVTVIPLPPQIRAGCGISLRISPSELDTAVRLVRDGHITERRCTPGKNRMARTATARLRTENLD